MKILLSTLITVVFVVVVTDSLTYLWWQQGFDLAVIGLLGAGIAASGVAVSLVGGARNLLAGVGVAILFFVLILMMGAIVTNRFEARMAMNESTLSNTSEMVRLYLVQNDQCPSAEILRVGPPLLRIDDNGSACILFSSGPDGDDDKGLILLPDSVARYSSYSRPWRFMLLGEMALRLTGKRVTIDGDLVRAVPKSSGVAVEISKTRPPLVAGE